jgi:biopolymer transport protein ExbD
VAHASCELQVTIASNKIKLEGPVKGSVARATDLHGALAKVDRTCSVLLAADDTPSYQEIVTTVGQLKAEGFSRLAVSDAFKAWTLPLKDTTSKKLVVTVSKLEVLVDGKSIGNRPDAPHLAAAVTAALEAIKARHEGATLVIQADEETSAMTINKLIVGAHNAGFDEVLFDVRARTR